jgi:acetyl-CoA C-acetyltransferase
MSEAYIVAAVRTAGGKRAGALSQWHPADLGGEVLNAIVDKTQLDPAAIDDVILGCVTQAGEQSFALARNAIFASKLPESVPGVTLDRQCGSSQQALHFAAQAVMSGTQDVVIAGGVESMTRVPMGSNYTLHAKEGLGTGPFSARIQKRFGVTDFNQFRGAQLIADRYGMTREELDTFALSSHRKAAAATESGRFTEEILPLAIPAGIHRQDEGIRFDASLQGIGTVKPLREGGLITAANASQICDGASAVLVMSERALKQHHLQPMARVHQLMVTGGDPIVMLMEPVNATRRALARAGMTLEKIDLYEVNEAFASVPLAWLRELHADPDKLNVNGGAIALGHPLGASGTKLMTTLLHALKARGKRWGLQTMCEGGGMANVTIVERL